MTTLTGTSGNDTLVGTDADDLLIALGGTDSLIGGLGADEYRLTQSGSGSRANIDDRGDDGAIDVITGGRGLYASASLGYQGWATAERVGDDLELVLPAKPSRFHSPGYPELSIGIKDHYAGKAVEYLEAGGTLYRLADGTDGSAEADIVAGTDLGELHRSYGGDDFIDAGAGDDTVISGADDDVIFADEGADLVKGGAGDDTIFGGLGDDDLRGGGGFDWIETGEGNNKVIAGGGDDFVFAGSGNDLLRGGAGWDRLSGGWGDDRHYGGKGGDTYVFGYDREALGTSEQWGHDKVIDQGSAAVYDAGHAGFSNDVLEIYGLYGPSDGNMPEAIAALEIARQGANMVIETLDGLSSITVLRAFRADSDPYFIEQVEFNGGYWTPVTFRVASGEREDLGDDRGGLGEWNEFIFASSGDDLIYADVGYNLIWTGDGEDSLIFKEGDPNNFATGYSLSAEVDVVMDFDVTKDRFDFTEIKGLTFQDLTIGSDAEGDATVRWDPGTIDIASISVELRGVDEQDLLPGLFDFA